VYLNIAVSSASTSIIRGQRRVGRDKHSGADPLGGSLIDSILNIPRSAPHETMSTVLLLKTPSLDTGPRELETQVRTSGQVELPTDEI
jgi:hypothetical protein